MLNSQDLNSLAHASQASCECRTQTPVDARYATRTVNVYLDDGRVFFYAVAGEAKAREHASAIADRGYRHNDGGEFEVYPRHRILKVKITGGPVGTSYFDSVRGS